MRYSGKNLTFTNKNSAKLKLQGELLHSRANKYAQTSSYAVSPFTDCVGFIDCTRIRMKRPEGGNAIQRSCFSGRRRIHCLIYQTLMAPDGLLFAMHGPLVRRRHDSTLLKQSNWEIILGECMLVDNRQFYIYGDLTYNIKPWLLRYFCAAVLSEEHHQFNACLSALRASAEHGYKEIKQIWTSQDFSRRLKVRQAPIGLLYQCSALLWNILVCLYGCGQVHGKFGVSPPSYEEYLS